MGVLGRLGGAGRLARFPDHAGCGLYGLSSPPHPESAPPSRTEAATPSARSGNVSVADVCMVPYSSRPNIRTLSVSNMLESSETRAYSVSELRLERRRHSR